MKTHLPRLATALICSLLLFGCAPTLPTPSPLPDPAASDISADTKDGNFLTTDDPVWGDAKAPMTMVVFSDFQCPFCAQLAQTLDKIEADWIKTGKLKVQYRDFPLAGHKNSLSAHIAAAAALRQGKYWEYHQRLYREQASWETLKTPSDYLVKLAQDLNLDMDKFVSDYNDPAIVRELIDDRNAGRRTGMEGTPAFLINGKLYQGALPIDKLVKELEATTHPKP